MTDEKYLYKCYLKSSDENSEFSLDCSKSPELLKHIPLHFKVWENTGYIVIDSITDEYCSFTRTKLGRESLKDLPDH